MNTEYNFNNKHTNVIQLTSKQNEISGISFSDDGNLFCHNDEIGMFFQIDQNANQFDVISTNDYLIIIKLNSKMETMGLSQN